MKNLVKIGLVAITVGIFASGCFGCGDGDRAHPHGIIDTAKGAGDSSKKTIDTTKAKIDTAKKDTSKK